MNCLHSTSRVLIAKALSLCFKKMSFFLSLPRNLVGRWHVGLQYLYCRMLSFWFWHTDEMKPFLWNETLFPCPRYHISATCLFQEGSCPLQTSSLQMPFKNFSSFCWIFKLCSLQLCISCNLTCTVEDENSAYLFLSVLFNSTLLHIQQDWVFLLIAHFFFISLQEGLLVYHF